MNTQALIDTGEHIWNAVGPYVPGKTMDALGLYALKLLFWYSDLWKDRYVKQYDLAGIPDAPLRYRVWGDPNIHSFLGSGIRCGEDIKGALQAIGMELTYFHRILDFGCGCGRILMFVKSELHPLAALYGTDIDKEAIDYCASTYAHRFQQNHHHPPLPYSSGFFDLVLAVGVFRHLNEYDQFIWLDELKRILKPYGIALVSLHGRYCWQNFPPRERKILETQGFLFKPLRDPYHRRVFPQWYQASYHNKTYITEHYSRYFHVLSYLTRGIENETDLVVLQKR